MNLTELIRSVIAQAEATKKAEGVNKKALNKTIARLEEAELWSKEIVLQGSLSATEPANSGACKCLPGVVDMTCPVHGQK